jgi:parvulin-like peptidyl-prolyl isomerase
MALVLVSRGAHGEPKSKPRKRIVERVVAVVNDSIVLESELTQRAAPMLAELDKAEDAREKQRQAQHILRQALDEIIAEELMMQAATEAQLEVTDEQVKKALDEVKTQNKLTDEQLEEALSAQGYTLAQYKRDLKRQLLRLRAVNVLVRQRVSVSDEDVRTYYDKMMGRAAAVTEIHVRHILLRLPEHPDPKDMDEARRRAGELVARAQAGEDFAKLALGNSEDETTKDKGGDLGRFKRSELATEWEEVLFALSPGDVRGPIRGPFGLHVFQVVDTKKDEVRPFDEVKEPLRQQLYNDELEKQTKVWLDELRKKAHVEVKL